MTVQEATKNQIEFTSLEEAVRNSKYAERVLLLQKNPELGHKIHHPRGGGQYELPNCWGTTTFLIGAEREFTDNWEHSVKDGLVHVKDNRIKGVCFFPEDNSAPGYVDTEYIAWFLLTKCTKVDEFTPDAIIATSGDGYRGGEHIRTGILHTSLFLGKVGKEAYVIEKEREGGLIGLGPLVKCWNVKKTEWFQYDQLNSYPT